MNIFIMALEPIETRYTCEWYHGLPSLLKDKGAEIFNVVGHHSTTDKVDLKYNFEETTPGAFLNFALTNIWKNNQLNILTRYFSNDVVKAGDKILFTDAWHSGIIQTKYMSELLDIPVEIHAIWHAGSYDSQDFLGRKIKDKRWSLSFERSLYHAIDYNYFATNFHMIMFAKTVLEPSRTGLDHSKMIRSGQPHNILMQQMKKEHNEWKKSGGVKRDLILFPHRIAPEKQPEIFKDLAKSMPQYEWVMCQEQNLTKREYHKLLFESKMVFSANLQETLGIGAMEAILAGSCPFVPDRLSYSEMYIEHFKYWSSFTFDWDHYQQYKLTLMDHIKNRMEMNNEEPIQEQLSILKEKYLNPEEMLNKLFE